MRTLGPLLLATLVLACGDDKGGPTQSSSDTCPQEGCSASGASTSTSTGTGGATETATGTSSTTCPQEGCSASGMTTEPGTSTSTSTSTSGSTTGASSGTDTSTSTGGTDASSGSSGSGGSTGGGLCPEPGTCVLSDGGPCELPTGPQGNGCCQCGPDDHCSAFCRCAAPDTAVATPAGERAIADLRPGDLVYSLDRGRIAAVPVLAVSKVPAPPEHAIVRVRLSDGRAVEMSPGHPTADGRLFQDLRAGDRLGDAAVVAVERVAYAHSFTYDILPSSDSGTYLAAGALVGSTLVPVSKASTVPARE